MFAESAPHVRIARPSNDLAAAEACYVGGLGLEVLYRTEGAGEPNELLMLGWPSAHWHLELTHNPSAPTRPSPTAEDLLVLYLARTVQESMVSRVERAGGRRVPAHNPYWDRWGVTIEDPDGYRLVLCERSWGNAEAVTRSP